MARSGALLGRDRELRVLRKELEAALHGETRIAFLLGEAGIGKTRTGAALMEEARNAGATVAWGRGHGAGGAPIYRPWVQVLTALARALPEASREPVEAACEALQTDASSLTGESSPARARFALFDRVGLALAAVAAEQPLVLVLDDLHWADLGSLRLLEFVTREIVSAPLLIVGALRDGEGRPDDERARVLSAVIGQGRSVSLRGLGDEAVGALLGDRLEDPPGTELVDQVLTTTGGNPFLVIEVANLLAASDGVSVATAVPPGARELLRERLSVLDSAERRALEVASVVGLEFDLTLLVQLLTEPEAQVQGWLESMAARGLVRELESSPRRYSFAHALLRETLYGGLSTEARIPLHAAVARAIEALESSREEQLPILAHHYFEAAKDGETRRAVLYCAAAGEQALERLAFEEAARHFERALSAENQPEDDGRWRLLAGLAQAIHGGGEHQRARGVFERAVGAARAAGHDAFASAVLRFASAEAETMVPDPEMNGLLEEALAELPPDGTALRALLLARLAWALHLVPGSEERGRRLSDKAAELARALDDPRTLDIVLGTRLLGLVGPDDTVEREATLDEILAKPSTASAELNALGTRIGDLAENGDRGAFDRALAVYEHKARALRQPFFLWGAANFRTAIAILEGRYAEAEALAKEALRIGNRVLSHSPMLQFAQQIFVFYGWQGRLAEIEAPLTSGLASSRVVPGWRHALTYFYCFAGRETEARREFEALAAEDFSDLARDGAWSMSINLLGAVCAHLDDERRAATLYEMLRPYSGRLMVTRPFVVFGPPVDLTLARLATTLARFDVAEEHFAAALATLKRMRGSQWQAELGYLHAEMLRRRDGEGDRSRALVLLDEAESLARSIGMTLLVEWIEQRRSELDTTPLASAGLPTVGAEPVQAAQAAFRRNGDMWTIGFESRTSHYRDMRGLGYLARLLAEPGREMHVLDLAGESHGQGQPSVRGDGGEQLDSEARSAYETRLRDAAEERDEAERMNDRGRLESLRDEIELLSAELSRGFGLGGRARRAGSNQERARVAVMRAIKYAIDKIEAHDTALAEHLRASVRTGAFVSYSPSSRDLVSWKL